MSVDSTIFNAILTVSVLLIALIYTERRFRKYDDLANSVSQLFRYEEDENGNPMLDARLVKIIESLGSSIAKSLKFSVLGSISGQARLEKGLKSAITQDLIDNQMPILNLIGDFLGINTKKYIAKHPEAFMQLMQHFAPTLLKLKLGNGSQNNPWENNPYWGWK